MFIVIIVITVSKNHYRDSHNNIYHPREYLSVSVCFHTNAIYFPYSMICLYACTHCNKHKPGNQAFWLHIIPRYAGQFNIESIFSSVYILANITWIWNGANFRLLYQWLVKPSFFFFCTGETHMKMKLSEQVLSVFEIPDFIRAAEERRANPKSPPWIKRRFGCGEKDGWAEREAGAAGLMKQTRCPIKRWNKETISG